MYFSNSKKHPFSQILVLLRTILNISQRLHPKIKYFCLPIIQSYKFCGMSTITFSFCLISRLLYSYSSGWAHQWLYGSQWLGRSPVENLQAYLKQVLHSWQMCKN